MTCDARNETRGKAKATDRGRLAPDEAVGLRRDLRRGLTRFANGHDDLANLLHAIERIAKCVDGNPDQTLGGARKAMRRFVDRHAHGRVTDTGLPGLDFDSLYTGVRDGRNDNAHTGTEAALAGARAAALAVVLMEALADAARAERTQEMWHVMVSNPTCAQRWQTLADVRRTMLVNDYTVLPIAGGYNKKDGTWPCVTAIGLAKYLRGNGRARKGMKLAEALTEANGRLDTFCAVTVRPETPVACLLGESGCRLPVVVTTCVEAEWAMVGVVTAFDLL